MSTRGDWGVIRRYPKKSNGFYECQKCNETFIAEYQMWHHAQTHIDEDRVNQKPLTLPLATDRARNKQRKCVQTTSKYHPRKSSRENCPKDRMVRDNKTSNVKLGFHSNPTSALAAEKASGGETEVAVQTLIESSGNLNIMKQILQEKQQFTVDSHGSGYPRQGETTAPHGTLKRQLRVTSHSHGKVETGYSQAIGRSIPSRDGEFVRPDPNYVRPGASIPAESGARIPLGKEVPSLPGGDVWADDDSSMTSQERHETPAYVNREKPGPKKGSRRGRGEPRPTQYSCKECGKTYGYSHLLKRHMRKHDGSKPYKCDTCGHRFRLYDAWKRHLLVHTGEKPLACSQCDRRFRDYSNLKQHMESHRTVNTFICDTCGRAYKNARLLKQHSCRPAIDRKKTVSLSQKFGIFKPSEEAQKEDKANSPDGSVFCKVCFKKFNHVTLLEDHLVADHGKSRVSDDMIQKRAPRGRRSTKPRSHVCIFCHKELASLQGLKLHLLRIHKQEYDYLSQSERDLCARTAATDEQDTESVMSFGTNASSTSDALLTQGTYSTNTSDLASTIADDAVSYESDETRGTYESLQPVSPLQPQPNAQTSLPRITETVSLANPAAFGGKLTKEQLLQGMLKDESLLDQLTRLFNNYLMHRGLKRAAAEAPPPAEISPPKRVQHDTDGNLQYATMQQAPNTQTMINSILNAQLVQHYENLQSRAPANGDGNGQFAAMTTGTTTPAGVQHSAVSFAAGVSPVTNPPAIPHSYSVAPSSTAVSTMGYDDNAGVTNYDNSHSYSVSSYMQSQPISPAVYAEKQFPVTTYANTPVMSPCHYDNQQAVRPAGGDVIQTALNISQIEDSSSQLYDLDNQTTVYTSSQETPTGAHSPHFSNLNASQGLESFDSAFNHIAPKRGDTSPMSSPDRQPSPEAAYIHVQQTENTTQDVSQVTNHIQADTVAMQRTPLYETSQMDESATQEAAKAGAENNNQIRSDVRLTGDTRLGEGVAQEMGRGQGVVETDMERKERELRQFLISQCMIDRNSNTVPAHFPPSTAETKEIQGHDQDRDNDSPASVTLYPVDPASPEHAQHPSTPRSPQSQGHFLNNNNNQPKNNGDEKLIRNLPSYESTVARLAPMEDKLKGIQMEDHLKGIQTGEMIDFLLEERGFYKCKCGCLFADQVNYSLHKKMHYFDDILKCSFCETKYDTLEELFAHFQSHEK